MLDAYCESRLKALLQNCVAAKARWRCPHHQLVNERSAGPEMRLSDPEMASSMKAVQQRLKEDPAFGRDLLKAAGILTPKGKLAKSFGG